MLRCIYFGTLWNINWSIKPGAHVASGGGAPREHNQMGPPTTKDLELGGVDPPPTTKDLELGG